MVLEYCPKGNHFVLFFFLISEFWTNYTLNVFL
jgi:hypothetical protein